MVKEKTSEGLVAKLLMVGIVRIVVMLLSKSTGAFLQSHGHVRASRPWAMLGHRDARGNRACAGPNASHQPFLFSKAFSNLVSKVNL